MKTQLKRSGLVLLALMLTTTLALAQNDRDKGSDYHLDQNYEMNATGTLHLSSSDANVRIIGSNRTDVHVKIDRQEEIRGFSSRGGSFEVNVENRGGDLYVTERKGRGPRITMGSYRIDYEILIELPEGASLRVKGDDDDYYVRNVEGAIDMEADDGDIELVDCNGSRFDLNLEDGDLKMNGGQGKLYISLDDGDADILNGKFEELEMKVEDGTIIVETEISDSGIYDIRGDDARIEFVVLAGGGDFNITKDDGSVRASDKFETIRETDYRSELRLKGGKADVQIRTNDGRVRLSAR